MISHYLQGRPHQLTHTHIHTNLSSPLLSETKLSSSDKVVIGGTPSMATMEVLCSLCIMLNSICLLSGSYMGNFMTIKPLRQLHCRPSVLLKSPQSAFVEVIPGQL